MEKTAIITGGNKGIGLSITEAFIEAGYFVIIAARGKINLDKKFKSNYKFIKSDVCKEESHKFLVNKAKEITGRLDVYINNAGISDWKPINKVDKYVI